MVKLESEWIDWNGDCEGARKKEEKRRKKKKEPRGWGRGRGMKKYKYEKIWLTGKIRLVMVRE